MSVKPARRDRTVIEPPYDPKNPKPIVQPAPGETIPVVEVAPVIADPQPKTVTVTPTPEVKVKPEPGERKKREKKLTGIRAWNESVGGVNEVRLRDCIIYMLDISRESWWVTRLNKGKAFIKSGEGKIARLLHDSVPEAYHYEEDPLIGWKSKYVEGQNERVVEQYVARMPRSDEERDIIYDTFGVKPSTVKFLAKPDCKRCKGEGYYDKQAYADSKAHLINVRCECVEE